MSSRDKMCRIDKLNPGEILAKIRKIPVNTFEYRDQKGFSHVGCCSEDFFEQFRLGHSSRMTDHSDLIGILLACVKALDEKVQRLEGPKVEKRPRGRPPKNRVEV